MQTTNTKMIHLIANAIDKTSITLTSICGVFLFIEPGKLVAWAGLIAAVTTILYNTIKIIKELKNKK